MKLHCLTEQRAPTPLKFKKSRINLILADSVKNVILMGDGKLTKPLKNNDITITDIFDAIKSQRCVAVKNYNPDKTNKHLKIISLGPSYLGQQISKAIDRAVEERAIPHSYIPYLRIEIGLDIDPHTTSEKFIKHALLQKQAIIGKKLHENKEIQNLQDAKIAIELPQARQSERFSCGATVIQMISAYYGMNIRESDLIKKLGIDDNSGIKLSKIAKVAREMGLKTYKDKLTYEEILQTIDDKIPLVIAIKRTKINYYHFVIAIGYYENGIIFRDPSKFTLGYLPQQEFTNRVFKVDDKILVLAIFSDEKQYFSPQKVEKS